MYKRLLLVWPTSLDLTPIVNEVSGLFGAGEHLTLLAIETLPQAVVEEAVDRTGLLGAVTSLFAVPAALITHQTRDFEFEDVIVERRREAEAAAARLRGMGIGTDVVVRVGDPHSTIRECLLAGAYDAAIMPIVSKDLRSLFPMDRTRVALAVIPLERQVPEGLTETAKSSPAQAV